MRAADLLERHEDRGAVDQFADHGVTRAPSRRSAGAPSKTISAWLRAGSIPLRRVRATPCRSIRPHRQADVIRLVARRDDREMRDLPVRYRHLGAGQTATDALGP